MVRLTDGLINTMDYKRIYNNLIKRARERVLPDAVFFEKHHIIPRCMGGTDSAENICKLTLKEHFFAHLLLVKLYPKSYKLQAALWNMCHVDPRTSLVSRYKPSSRLYKQIRSDYMLLFRGQNHPLYGRKQKETHIKKAKEAKYKKVYQYTKDGLFIKEWSSAKEIEESLKIASSNISMVCTGKKACLTIAGFRWSYQFKEKLEPLERKRRTRSNLLLKYK